MKKTDKKILIINAHPYKESFCNALAQKYYQGAVENGFDVRLTNLYDLTFDPVLHCGYSVESRLEEDLTIEQENLRWCTHLVIVTPLWWNSLPSLLKGYFDRVFLPGFAFRYSKTSPMPEKLLNRKSASVIYTQGSPFLYTYFILKDSFWRTLKDGILGFCGFSPVKRIVFDRLDTRNEKTREKFLIKVYTKGAQGF